MSERSDADFLRDLSEMEMTYRRGFHEERFFLPEPFKGRVLKIADRLAEVERDAEHWRSVKATVLEHLK